MFFTTFNTPDFQVIIGELRTKSLPRVFRAYAAYRRSAINQQFAREVNPYGVKHPPLNVIYEIYKKRKWGDKPILIASGEMKNSFSQSVQGTRYTEGFSDYKAIFHQKGVPSRNLPRRQMVAEANQGLPQQDEAKLQQLVIDELERDWRKLGTKPKTYEELATVTPADVQSVLGEIAANANR